MKASHSQAKLTSTLDTDVLAGRNVLDTLRVITGKWKILPQPTASLRTFYILYQFCVKFIHFSLKERDCIIAKYNIL